MPRGLGAKHEADGALAILPELEKPLGQGGAGRFRLEMPKP